MISQFIPVSTKLIAGFTVALPFDVYIERSEGKFTTIYKKDSSQDENQLSRYETKNVQYLFINRDERIEFENFLVNLHGIENYDKDQIFEILRMGLELNYEHLEIENDELQTNLDLAACNVKSSLYLLENDVGLAIDIFKALASKSYLLKHSYMVSLFSIVIAKKLGITSNRTILSIGLGALLHDIGQTRIDEKIFSKNNLSPKDWDEIKDHPQLGLKILDHSKCINSDVRTIIIQHHEQFNGRGYPNRLHNNLIYPPAKMVAIADGFCSLTSKTSYRKTDRSPLEALEIMKDDLGHYDPEYMDVFCKMIIKK